MHLWSAAPNWDSGAKLHPGEHPMKATLSWTEKSYLQVAHISSIALGHPTTILKYLTFVPTKSNMIDHNAITPINDMWTMLARAGRLRTKMARRRHPAQQNFRRAQPRGSGRGRKIGLGYHYYCYYFFWWMSVQIRYNRLMFDFFQDFFV